MSHPVHRRSFLASATLLPVTGAFQRLHAVAAPARELAWEMVRRQFPFHEDRVPMNAANLCPSPRVVSDRVTKLTRDIDTDCSFDNRAKFGVLREQSRTKIARQLGVMPDEIAIVRNTSEGNNIINSGLPLKPGDEVVLWEQNHPTNNVAWDVRAARYGFQVKRVATPVQPSGEEELVDLFARALGPRTRVLALTHVSNVSGLKLPVDELCQVARKKGVYVHVDGAQTWGALDVDLAEMGCDSYAASAHKWLVGPKEAGLLFVKEERIADIWPSMVAPGWGSDREPDVEGARKFESFGQRDDACLAAVGTTVDFHNTLGPAQIESRIRDLAVALKQGLKEMGVQLVTPEDPDLSAGVCIIAVPPERRGEVATRLYEEHGLAGAPTGGLRLCPHIYNTMEHIERALQAVRTLKRHWV